MANVSPVGLTAGWMVPD